MKEGSKYEYFQLLHISRCVIFRTWFHCINLLSSKTLQKLKPNINSIIKLKTMMKIAVAQMFKRSFGR